MTAEDLAGYQHHLHEGQEALCNFCDEDDDDAEAGLSSASPTRSTTSGVSKSWFDKFQKCFRHKSVSLHGEAASVDKAGT